MDDVHLIFVHAAPLADGEVEECAAEVISYIWQGSSAVVVEELKHSLVVQGAACMLNFRDWIVEL